MVDMNKMKWLGVTVGLAVCCVLLGQGQFGAVNAQGDKKEGYGAALIKAEEKAKSQVKVTIVNNSGGNVRFVSWRAHHYTAFFSADLEDKGKATIENFAAEWRVNGVWALPTNESKPGWATAYQFEKDVTITIEKDTITIK